MERSRATSSARVKVRASASSARNARGVMLAEKDCRPIAVPGKSMVSAASSRSPQHLDRLRQAESSLGDESGAVDQEDEGRGGAVEDRHFRPVQLDDRIVDAAAGQRSHHMLDRADPRLGRAGQAEGGAEAGLDHMVVEGRDLDPDIGAAEPDAGPGFSRAQGQARALAAVQADPDAADGGFQRPAAACLEREVSVHAYPCWKPGSQGAAAGMSLRRLPSPIPGTAPGVPRVNAYYFILRHKPLISGLFRGALCTRNP
jgi:hypothetical protein